MNDNRMANELIEPRHPVPLVDIIKGLLLAHDKTAFNTARCLLLCQGYTPNQVANLLFHYTAEMCGK